MGTKLRTGLVAAAVIYLLTAPSLFLLREFFGDLHSEPFELQAGAIDGEWRLDSKGSQTLAAVSRLPAVFEIVAESNQVSCSNPYHTVCATKRIVQGARGQRVLLCRSDAPRDDPIRGWFVLHAASAVPSDSYGSIVPDELSVWLERPVTRGTLAWVLGLRDRLSLCTLGVAQPEDQRVYER